MRMRTTVIQDRFQHHYRLYVRGDAPVNHIVKAKEFSDSVFTENFVRRLSVPLGFWRRILSRVAAENFKPRASIEARISQLLIRGTLKLYPVKHLDQQRGGTSGPVISTAKGMSYKLVPASVLLVEPAAVAKTFTDKEQAVSFLTELEMDDAQRNELAAAMDISAADKNQPPDIQIAAMALALLENQLVIIANPPPIIAQPNGSMDNAPIESAPDQTSSLGPHEEPGGMYLRGSGEVAGVGAVVATSDSKEVEVIPKCVYKKFTLTCRHGNTVTLDTAKPAMNGDTLPTLQIVSSQNEKLKDASGQPIFDILSVEADIEDVCPTHKTSFISISDSAATLISPQSNGKSAKFKSPSKQIKISTGSSLLKYLWLPNVETDGVNRYKVCALQSCDFNQFDGKGKCIRVEVYPYIKWMLNFSINLGSIKNDDKPSDNKLAFEGTLKLHQNNEKADEFTADYKKKLQVFENTLSNFRNILNDNIFDKFKEGRDIKIDVALPKIALNYDTQFKEKPGSHLVIRTHEFSFQADPFVKIAASVDILPVIVKFLGSWWSNLFNVFFDWIKQKIGKEDGKAHIQAGISFIVEIEGGLSAKFSHTRDESEKTTLTGEPVTSKIKIKAEGKAKLDGHIYVIKVQVILKTGLESSIDMGLSLSEEEGAPYVSLDFMFNGIKLYLEKEIQLRLVKDTKEASSLGNDMYGDAPDEEVGIKEIKRSEPRVWLEMSKKHQLKYYLKKEDQQEILSKKEVEETK